LKKYADILDEILIKVWKAYEHGKLKPGDIDGKELDRLSKNALEYIERIKELTSFALSSKDEFIRIMCPQLLKGVSWGVASVILHFTYPSDYSIIDFRAVWSLGWKQPQFYTFDYWMNYTIHIRELAKKINAIPRVIDKALWQYSKENQN